VPFVVPEDATPFDRLFEATQQHLEGFPGPSSYFH
jgi:hypothetical protein